MRGSGRRRRFGPVTGLGAALVVGLVIGVSFGLAAGSRVLEPGPATAGLVVVLAVWAGVTGLLVRRSRLLEGLTGSLEAELTRRREPEVLALSQLEDDLRSIRRVIDGDEITMALQPIVWLPTNEIVGYEALARFADGVGPAEWFERAHLAGMGVDLELCCIRLALSCLDDLPPDTYLSLNASPETLLSDDLAALVDRPGSNRIVIELTEHLALAAYESYIEAVGRLRALGVRLAVDDAGAGFASLRHVVSLGPDIVKLDRSLVAEIDTDALRRSLVHGLASFARATKTSLVAEGVETRGEAAALVEEGVAFGQGFWFCRPGPAQSFRTRTVVGTPLGEVRVG